MLVNTQIAKSRLVRQKMALEVILCDPKMPTASDWCWLINLSIYVQVFWTIFRYQKALCNGAYYKQEWCEVATWIKWLWWTLNLFFIQSHCVTCFVYHWSKIFTGSWGRRKEQPLHLDKPKYACLSEHNSNMNVSKEISQYQRSFGNTWELQTQHRINTHAQKKKKKNCGNLWLAD